MIKEMKMNLFLLTVMAFINVGCKAEKNKTITAIKIKEEQKIEEVIVTKVKDSIIHLNGMKLKSDVAKSYTAVKESVKLKKIKLNQKEVSIA